MNEHETPSPSPVAETAQQPAPTEVACLQKQITYLTIALLISSMTFCIFMWRQDRVTGYDLTNFKVGAVQVITAYQKDKPQWDAFVAKVAEYGSKHPDFAPIMNKYRISTTTNAPGAAPTAAPTTPAQPR